MAELATVCQQALNAEENGLLEGQHYTIDLQRGKRPGQVGIDVAPGKLITWINPDVWKRPSYTLFKSLLNNYNLDSTQTEIMTPQKEREISNFLNEVVNSGPMAVIHQYCASKNLVAADKGEYKRQLHNMWFSLYGRGGGRQSSSGFEHTFVGESKDGELTGLHNWIQFYNLEQTADLDYRGYIYPRNRAGGGDPTVLPSDLLLSVQFALGGQQKGVSSMFIGTSPEFEMAIYTLFFIAGQERNVVELTAPTGMYEVEIRAYHIRGNQGDRVGSAFPSLLSKHASTAQAQYNQQHQQPAWQGQQQPQNGYQPMPGYPSQGQYQPSSGYPSQQAYSTSQANQQNANQGCGNILAEILKAIFKRFSN